MSISLSVAVQIPTNVVEVGNEISTQQLGAITSGFSPTSANPFTTASYINSLSFATQSYVTTRGYITNSALSGYATQSYVTSQGYLTDAPSDGSEYVRKNAAWAVATGGGGGGISDAPSDGNLYARQNAAWTSFTVPTLSVTNIDLTGDFNGYSMGSGNYTFKFDSTANTLRMQDSVGSGITISPTGITFPNSSVLSSAPARSVNTLSGSYTLAATDTNNIVFVPTGAGGGFPLTITFPDDGTHNFPIGTVIMLCVDNTVSGTSISFSTTLMGSPTVVGSLFSAGISSSQTGQWFMTKLGSNYWIIS